MARYTTATAGTSGDYSTVTWIRWNTVATSSATCSQYTSTGVTAWTQWQDTGSTGSTITCSSTNAINATWVHRNVDGDYREAYENRQIQFRQGRETEERVRREVDANIKALKKAKEGAELKAKQLLEVLIGASELEVYERTGRLFVKGKKHDYIVQKEGFVLKLEKNRVVDLCVHLAEKQSMPDTDNVVALKLMLENEEDKILDMANDHGSRSRPRELPRAACANWN